MLDTNQRKIAESQFERNQRREAEVALKQEQARHEAAVHNMHRLRELRLARDAKPTGSAMSARDSSKFHGR